ncbi:UPF0547 protein C16orf87 homolog [Trichogramma pretiosum]|uniref:UPF0547 protein C16orf87 homolog n=1 Tax=Trichogramma pretiosum TaxID=7493 RepID=UPI0006C9DAD8|nr:UPF0547 protein C16orf87 homolog [Trichogramma pretiosum]XP_014223768.1 UPF0547 protein C16orf87 homolog [Trichogramma pretiosum]
MAKTKTIAKGCPKCEQQVPVACKACRCGHSFFNARRSSIKSPPSPELAMRTRRTNRVKREKPVYYDALVIEKQTRKSTKLKKGTETDGDVPEISAKKKKKGKGKKGGSSGGDDYDETEGVSSLSPEKQLTCSLILRELNNKLLSTSWKPQ